VKGFLLCLIGALLAGCATTAPQPPEITARLISPYWEQAQKNLKGAAPDLRAAFEAEAKAQLVKADGRELQENEKIIKKESASTEEKTRKNTATGTLNDLLDHANNPLLQPDNEFSTVSSVVSGGQQTMLLLQALYAATLTDYLTRPAFNCQQPIEARYFQKRYSAGSTAEACRDPVPFNVITRYEGMQPLWIDPARVRSIHLLFAGNGEGIASRFGHVALRFVICPENLSDEVSCNENLAEHVVVGFQAHINDLEISMVKALRGGYQAHLFANRFMDIYQDYTIGEFRDLYSLPLRMSKDEREQMVRELAEVHWRYSGDYRFFTRNCTTLLQNTLHALSPGFVVHKEMAGTYLRPDNFFKAVKSSALAEGSKLELLKSAEQEGYFFSSTKPFYDQALTVVHGAMSAPVFTDVRTYLREDPVRRRQAITQDQHFTASLAQDPHLLGAQLMLEELSLIRSERRLMAAAALYFHGNFPTKIKAIQAKLSPEQNNTFNHCLLAPIALLAQPLQRLPGIPDKSSPAVIGNTTVSSCLTAGHLSRLREALAVISATDPAHWRQVAVATHYWAESINNINFLKEKFTPATSRSSTLND
jgi:hypothetical protein